MIRRETQDDPGYLLKICMVGGMHVGKSAFRTRYTGVHLERFSSLLLRVPFEPKVVPFRGETFKIEVWDACVNEDSVWFMPQVYYDGAFGIILAYDITNRKSFERLHEWSRTIKRVSKAGNIRPTVLLVGMKSDLGKTAARAVKREEGRAFASQHGMWFTEASAKLGIGVTEAFNILVEDAWNQLHPPPVSVFTLLKVAPQDNGMLTLSMSSMGGDSFDVVIPADDAIVRTALIGIGQARKGLQRVALVTPGRRALAVGSWIPGAPKPRWQRLREVCSKICSGITLFDLFD